LKVLSEEKSSLLIKFIKSTLEDAKQKEIWEEKDYKTEE
jgi:hypothetical protein